jgi:hypothetical protein
MATTAEDFNKEKNVEKITRSAPTVEDRCCAQIIYSQAHESDRNEVLRKYEVDPTEIVD